MPPQQPGVSICRKLWHRPRNKSVFGETPVRRLVIAAMAWAAVGCAVAPIDGLCQRAPDLRKPSGKEWLTIGGDWGNTRYSTLAQINRGNVKSLKGAWAIHLGSGLGAKYSMEGTPLVKDGVMVVTTGNDDVYALDARTGALIWEN